MTTRDEYVAKIEAKLDRWDAEIDKLDAKRREAEADARIEYDKTLEELRGIRDGARRQLEEAKSTGAEAWNDVRSGFEEVWERVRKGFQEAAGRLR